MSSVKKDELAGRTDGSRSLLCTIKSRGQDVVVGSLSLLCVIVWDNTGGLTIHAARNQMGVLIFPALGEQTGVRTDRGHLSAVWDHRAGRGAWGCMGVHAHSLAHSPLELLLAPGQVLGFIPHQV